MALTDITYHCGHTARIQIYGTNTHGERDRKAAWYATIDCPDCHRRHAAAWCADNGCAPLEGSPRQVAWAETIRHDAIAGLMQARQDAADAGAPPDYLANADRIIADAQARATAAWWIDRRDTPAVREATARHHRN